MIFRIPSNANHSMSLSGARDDFAETVGEGRVTSVTSCRGRKEGGCGFISLQEMWRHIKGIKGAPLSPLPASVPPTGAS